MWIAPVVSKKLDEISRFQAEFFADVDRDNQLVPFLKS